MGSMYFDIISSTTTLADTLNLFCKITIISLEMADIHRVIFPGLASFVIQGSFWSVDPSYLLVRLRNGRRFHFYARDGFTWERNFYECVIHGWTVATVWEFCQVNGRPLPLANLHHFCFGTPSPGPPAWVGSPIVIPDVPSEDLSSGCDLGSSEGLDEQMFADTDTDMKSELGRLDLGYDVFKLKTTRRRLFAD